MRCNVLRAKVGGYIKRVHQHIAGAEYCVQMHHVKDARCQSTQHLKALQTMQK